ncbi:MAG: LptA/OstA family protein [Candidatus Omnitrophota bacterium]
MFSARRYLIIKCSFCFLLFNFCFLLSCYAQDNKQPISVNGDTVEYLTKEKKIIASGNVVVVYQGSKLTCDNLEVSTQTKDGIASGNVVLRHKDIVMRGEKINYNFDTKTGKIVNADIDAPPMYAHGDLINKDQGNRTVIDGGYVTSCDLEHPHYRIRTRQIEFYPDEKIIAKNVKIFAGNIPIFFFPRFVHYLKTDNAFNFNITPGSSKDWGTFILTKTRFNLSDKVRGRVYLDYRERRGWGEGFGINYDYGALGAGDYKAYYTNEQIPEAGPGTTERQRYLLRFRHKTQLKNTDIISEFHRTSDINFLKDYFYREYQSDVQPKSYIYVTHNFLPINSNLSAYYLKRTNHFYSEIDKLPEIKFETNNQSLFGSPVYFKNITTLTNFTHKFISPTDIDYDQVRFDTLNKLSFPFKAAFLELTPYGGSRETFYKKDIAGDGIAPRTAVVAGLDASAKLFKVYDFKMDSFGLDINKIRHIINPVARFSYTHKPTIPADKLREFDDIDKIENDKQVIIELINKLQTKTKNDVSRDLAIFRVDTSYIFKDFYTGKGKFSNIYFDLEIWPYEWVHFETEATYDKSLNVFDTVNIDLDLNQKKWSYLTGFRYRRSVGKQMISQFRYRINPLWEFRTYQRFEFSRATDAYGEPLYGLREQEYAISRDLHCWLLSMAYNVKKNGGHTVWFTLTCKAFPEAELRMDATYSGPRTESSRAW